jgi:predicted  nucleic acid-binding Zn-ribbon protein
VKNEIDMKNVRILELETENGELKTIIEQMTKEIGTIREQKIQQNSVGKESTQNEQLYELRREVFKL